MISDCNNLSVISIVLIFLSRIFSKEINYNHFNKRHL